MNYQQLSENLWDVEVRCDTANDSLAIGVCQIPVDTIWLICNDVYRISFVNVLIDHDCSPDALGVAVTGGGVIWNNCDTVCGSLRGSRDCDLVLPSILIDGHASLYILFDTVAESENECSDDGCEDDSDSDHQNNTYYGRHSTVGI